MIFDSKNVFVMMAVLILSGVSAAAEASTKLVSEAMYCDLHDALGMTTVRVLYPENVESVRENSTPHLKQIAALIARMRKAGDDLAADAFEEKIASLRKFTHFLPAADLEAQLKKCRSEPWEIHPSDTMELARESFEGLSEAKKAAFFIQAGAYYLSRNGEYEVVMDATAAEKGCQAFVQGLLDPQTSDYNLISVRSACFRPSGSQLRAANIQKHLQGPSRPVACKGGCSPSDFQGTYTPIVTSMDCRSFVKLSLSGDGRAFLMDEDDEDGPPYVMSHSEFGYGVGHQEVKSRMDYAQGCPSENARLYRSFRSVLLNGDRLTLSGRYEIDISDTCEGKTGYTESRVELRPTVDGNLQIVKYWPWDKSSNWAVKSNCILKRQAD